MGEACCRLSTDASVNFQINGPIFSVGFEKATQYVLSVTDGDGERSSALRSVLRNKTILTIHPQRSRQWRITCDQVFIEKEVELVVLES